MGCWYSTCFMSNLPIMPGDDIAIFVLAPNYPDEKDGMTCYPNERYTPIGFPIFAEYDDDVQIRNIREINEYMSRYLHEFVKVYTRTRKTDSDHNEYFEFHEYKWDDIEDFLRSIAYGELYVDDSNNKKRRLEHVMMHTDLYFALINNVANRIPYDKTETYESLMYGKVLRAIEWVKDEDEVEKAMRLKYGIDIPFSRRFTDKVHIDTFTRWNSLDKIVRYYIETEDGRIIDDIVNHILWSVVMNYSRKGYHCYSGGGSQCQEMMLQKVIAEYVIVKCTEREMEDSSDKNVLEETLFFWDD